MQSFVRSKMGVNGEKAMRSRWPAVTATARGVMGVAALVALAACASESPSSGAGTGTTQQAVIQGTEDAKTTSVVAVVNTKEECSGYLITPDLVLTARHCAAAVNNASGGCGSADGGGSPSTGGKTFAASDLEIFTDAIASASSKPKSVAEVFLLPDSEGAPLCGADLALLRLSAPLDGVTPIGLRLDAPPSKGEAFTAIGYGESVPGSGDSDRRRSGPGAVESIGASSQSVDGEWTATTGPCAGDSGSPAIDANGDSIGVMSHGSKSTCQHMVYERVDTHADWLREQANASATRLGIDPPAWAATPGGGDAGADGGGAAASSDSRSGCAIGGTRGWARVGGHAPKESGVVAALLAIAAVLAARRRRRARG